MGTLDGRVALVTGAARGMGRSHALRLASEGADLVLVDVCGPIDTVAYPLATPAELDETAALVERAGRSVVSRVADVRDLEALRAVVEEGTTRLGGVDVVVANAGIAFGAEEQDPAATFRTLIEVNLTGVWNTVTAAAPGMIERARGGSIVLISSTQGLTGRGGTGSGGSAGYTASKHGVVGLMRNFTHWLAPHAIRVNSVHPTGVATPMVTNDVMASMLTADSTAAAAMQNLMPVPVLESGDVSAAVAWLASDEARFVTGVTLPVDAGFVAR